MINSNGKSNSSTLESTPQEDMPNCRPAEFDKVMWSIFTYDNALATFLSVKCGYNTGYVWTMLHTVPTEHEHIFDLMEAFKRGYEDEKARNEDPYYKYKMLKYDPHYGWRS